MVVAGFADTALGTSDESLVCPTSILLSMT